MKRIFKEPPIKEKERFVGTFGDLLKNGFTFIEAIAVMERSRRFQAELLQTFRQELEKGAPLPESFASVRFTPQEAAQIQLAQEHGDLIGTLENIRQQLELLGKQKRELRKVLSYPLILLVFLSLVLVSLRQILLPQLLATGMVKPDHPGVLFIRHGPVVLALLFCGALSAILLMRWRFGKKSAIQRSKVLSGLPFFGEFYQLYSTMYFSLEWGKLFQVGLELREILQLMQLTDGRSLTAELARELQRSLTQGQALPEQLRKYPFLTPEFPLIVFQGSAKGKLGEELLIYNRLLQQQFFAKIEKGLQWVQPIIFLVIALLVVSVYGSLFLPLYSNFDQIM